VQNLEASITLCDPLNPGFGYQIRITRAAPPGAPIDVLFTASNPATGESLLTYEQCLDVLAMYRSTSRPGFILRTEDSKHHFFSSYIKGEVQCVEAGNHAWFTMHRETATTMALELALQTGASFEVVPYAHNVL
jgi:hypothetical protein